MRIVLFNPPLTQLNTPYPGITFLAGWLRRGGHQVWLMDGGMVLLEHLLSPQGLSEVFALAHGATATKQFQAASLRVLEQEASYKETIKGVVDFLAGDAPGLAWRIAARNWLPEGRRFAQIHQLDEDFGPGSVEDRARLYATTYLEELTDFIKDTIDGDFGLSRYAEKIGRSPGSFATLKDRLDQEPGFISSLWLGDFLDLIKTQDPHVVGISIPFPGNVVSAFVAAAAVRKHRPNAMVLGGGGWVNTELRSLKEPRVFDYFHALTLDDGYEPLAGLLNMVATLGAEALVQGGIADHAAAFPLVRTLVSTKDGQVQYLHDPLVPRIPLSETGIPWYGDLLKHRYLHLVDSGNPMHRLWGAGRWNKLLMSHGCYWKSCAFCDTSLDYICHYEPLGAHEIADRMDALHQETKEVGFHFVDEAAPPALMERLSKELIKRGRAYAWWTNIRYDKNFKLDRCKTLADAGLIAVTGGIEVASERILQSMGKGVSLPVLARVLKNFTQAGIMTHGYLMYGFPGQTAQETMDSLEAVRQLFSLGILHSAFWHRLTVTAHSPLGRDPQYWGVKLQDVPEPSFARNDLDFHEPGGIDHDRFGPGLVKAVYNWMHGKLLDAPLQSWFSFKVPKPTLAPGIMEVWMDMPDPPTFIQ